MSTVSKKELHELKVNIGKSLKSISRKVPEVEEKEALKELLDQLLLLDQKLKEEQILSLKRRIELLDQE